MPTRPINTVHFPYRSRLAMNTQVIVHSIPTLYVVLFINMQSALRRGDTKLYRVEML